MLLQERIELHGLEDQFGEVLVPTEEVVEMRAGQKRRSERKFFPGYVLVQMELNDDTWHLVKSTPRVMGFIGGKADKPAPMSDAEATRFSTGRRKVATSRRRRRCLSPARWSGSSMVPFNDFNGVVEEVNYEKSRLRVAVTILGRSTPVELDFGQVENCPKALPGLTIGALAFSPPAGGQLLIRRGWSFVAKVADELEHAGRQGELALKRLNPRGVNMAKKIQATSSCRSLQVRQIPAPRWVRRWVSTA